MLEDWLFQNQTIRDFMSAYAPEQQALVMRGLLVFGIHGLRQLLSNHIGLLP
jgi:hypothetical protein